MECSILLKHSFPYRKIGPHILVNVDSLNFHLPRNETRLPSTPMLGVTNEIKQLWKVVTPNKKWRIAKGTGSSKGLLG